MAYPRLAARLYNAPLLITPEKAEVIEAVFRAHVEGRQAELPPADSAERQTMAASIQMRRTDAGYYVTNSGVAVLPVFGSLVQRADSMDAASGLTGYNRLTTQLDTAMRDPMVRGVVMEIDSPGGEVAGAFELANFLADAAKPVWAVANEMAASAAYLLASHADRVYLPATAQVGSIGVVMLHVDRSQQVAKSGLVYTPIFAGRRKLDGTSLAPLSEEARRSAQDQVDRLYGMFVDAVANGRGMKSKVVRDTEAAMLAAPDAVKQGFADGIATLGQAVQMMTDDLNAGQGGRRDKRRMATPSAQPEVHDMTDKTGTAPAQMVATAEQVEAAKSEAYNAGVEAGRAESEAPAEAIAQAVATERARVAAILTHAEAAGRESMAQHLAFNTDTTPDVAGALMAVAPKAGAAATNALAAAMAMVPNPQVGGDVDRAGKGAATINATAIYDRRAAAVKSAQ